MKKEMSCPHKEKISDCAQCMAILNSGSHQDNSTGKPPLPVCFRCGLKIVGSYQLNKEGTFHHMCADSPAPTQIEESELREQINDLVVRYRRIDPESDVVNTVPTMDAIMSLIEADRRSREADIRKEAENEGWRKGWEQRGKEEDHSDVINRLKSMKPQPGAFFLIGEIEQACKEARAALSDHSKGGV